eukprot:gene14385-14179_t
MGNVSFTDKNGKVTTVDKTWGYVKDSSGNVKILGFAANLTQVETQDYSLTTYGATVGWNERVEFSLGEQVLDTGITGTALTGAGLDLKQQIVGVKVRVFGDGVLDADTWYPQVAVGLQHKMLDAAALEPTLTSLGADDSGTDFYVTATKLFLKQGVLVNGTLRATKANQNGLLGFGSTTDDSYELMPEISVAKLLSHNLAIGAEYRMMPNNLEAAGRNAGLNSGLRADDWMDLFVAWAPTKNLSLTAAYVDLGRIVPATTDGRSQTGFYLSEKSLYEQLGGKESIRLVMDDFVVRLKADPRIGDQFAATNADRLAS